jgi:group II intron reverse transcriptase/maturase
VTQALSRIRQAAKRNGQARFTALLHHVTPELLEWSFYRLKRSAAPGVDGVTWSDYEEDLQERLADLHGRVQRGAYRALPSRRQYLPKSDGQLRPLGIAAVEDKIVQRAVVAVLNAIYETEFLGFSYGFRPGRSQHDALDALAVAINRRKVNWVVDLDIRNFFGSLSHEWLRRFLAHRIGDRRILRLINQWLRAGVLEDGVWTQAQQGTPQGAVISPVLANVFLHYVYDLWAQRWRRREARGLVSFVRYADDAVAAFQYEYDARRFLRDLQARLRAFELELHPGKTRLIRFGRFAARDRGHRGLGKPETFDFLGFTHICGQTREGRFLLLRHTQRRRLRAALLAIKEGLRVRRHWPLAVQGQWLNAVVRGYFAYHGIPTNLRKLHAFRHYVIRYWRQSLRRRSQKHRLAWRRMTRIANRWVPAPRLLHPLPDQRFDVNYPRQEPDAVVPHVRICAGGAG